MSEPNTRRRLVVIGLIVVALFAGLLTRLWFLQVAGGEDLAVAAQQNGDKIVQIPAIRGRILDAKGRVLAETMPVTSLVIDRQQLTDATRPEAGRQPGDAAQGHAGEHHQGDRQPELPGIPADPDPPGRQRRDRHRAGRARRRLSRSVAREQLRACVSDRRGDGQSARGARGGVRRPHQPRGVRGAQGRRLRQRRHHRQGRRGEALRVGAARHARARARAGQQPGTRDRVAR